MMFVDEQHRFFIRMFYKLIYKRKCFEMNLQIVAQWFSHGYEWSNDLWRVGLLTLQLVLIVHQRVI